MSVPRLINIMREQGKVFNETVNYFGEVLTTSPLQIQTNGITLGTNNLKILNQNNLQSGDVVLLLKTGVFFVVLGKVISP